MCLVAVFSFFVPPLPPKKATNRRCCRIPEILDPICFLTLHHVVILIKKVLHSFVGKKQKPQMSCPLVNRAFWLITTYELWVLCILFSYIINQGYSSSRTNNTTAAYAMAGWQSDLIFFLQYERFQELPGPGLMSCLFVNQDWRLLCQFCSWSHIY